MFVHDRKSGKTTRVNRRSDGKLAWSGDSSVAAISAKGRYVAFASEATNLVRGDTNGVEAVFVHDRSAGKTRRVSVRSDGTQGNDFSNDPAISADGRYVAFRSNASDLVKNDTSDDSDVFRRGPLR